MPLISRTKDGGAAGGGAKAAECAVCGAPLDPPSRPVCPACGTERSRDGTPALKPGTRDEIAAEAARLRRAVIVVSLVYGAIFVVLFAVAKGV